MRRPGLLLERVERVEAAAWAAYHKRDNDADRSYFRLLRMACESIAAFERGRESATLRLRNGSRP